MQHIAIVYLFKEFPMENVEHSQPSLYFSLLHICDALRSIENDQVQVLNRVLFSRIEEYRNIENKIVRTERYNLNTLPINKTEPISVEIVGLKQKQSAFEKKRHFAEKQRRGIELQIIDVVSTLSKFFEKNPEFHNSQAHNLVLKKLGELETHLK